MPEIECSKEGEIAFHCLHFLPVCFLFAPALKQVHGLECDVFELLLVCSCGPISRSAKRRVEVGSDWPSAFTPFKLLSSVLKGSTPAMTVNECRSEQCRKDYDAALEAFVHWLDHSLEYEES